MMPPASSLDRLYAENLPPQGVPAHVEEEEEEGEHVLLDSEAVPTSASGSGAGQHLERTKSYASSVGRLSPKHSQFKQEMPGRTEQLPM